MTRTRDQDRGGVADSRREPRTPPENAPPEETGASGSTSAVRTAFWTILLAGFALRFWAATYSAGIIHPDEHQQYLEAAQGIVYGYNVTFWEYERGVRHYLYPGMLAGLLYTFDAVGITAPLAQATVIRGLLGIAVLASLALVAQDWLRRGRVLAGLSFLALVSFSPDMVFIGARTLSETAMIPLLMLGYYYWKRNPLLTGFLFGMMFAIRFQSAIFTATFFAITVSEDLASGRKWRQWACTRMLGGLALSLLCVGWIDKMTWGAWFHSPIEYFRANIVEGVAAKHGVEPWYRYLEWVAYAWGGSAPFVVLLLLLGAFREWRLAIVTLVFFVAHSLVAHKEARFIWPELPLALMLMATGVETALASLRPGKERRLAVVALAGILLVGAWLRSEAIDWPLDPQRASFLTLAKVGEMDDVTGVAFYGLDDVDGGNYFYLRRNLPYVIKKEPYFQVIRDSVAWQDGRINYLVAEPESVPLFDDVRLEEIEVIHGWGIYKVHRSSQTAPVSASADGS